VATAPAETKQSNKSSTRKRKNDAVAQSGASRGIDVIALRREQAGAVAGLEVQF
jgi:hypothetical protein